MKKKDRQKLIKKLLSNNDIQKQEEFVELLAHQGVEVTQATVSRDIKEMQLIKIPSIEGNYRYSMPVQKNVDIEKKLIQTINDSFVSIDIQEKMIFMKVLPGSGPVVSSLFYQMNYDEIFGTIGDDNTVLIICKSEHDAIGLKNRLNSILGNVLEDN